MPDYDMNDQCYPRAYRSDQFNPSLLPASRGAGNFIGYQIEASTPMAVDLRDSDFQP